MMLGIYIRGGILIYDHNTKMKTCPERVEKILATKPKVKVERYNERSYNER